MHGFWWAFASGLQIKNPVKCFLSCQIVVLSHRKNVSSRLNFFFPLEYKNHLFLYLFGTAVRSGVAPTCLGLLGQPAGRKFRRSPSKNNFFHVKILFPFRRKRKYFLGIQKSIIFVYFGDRLGLVWVPSGPRLRLVWGRSSLSGTSRPASQPKISC